jgi:hypothetical protein
MVLSIPAPVGRTVCVHAAADASYTILPKGLQCDELSYLSSCCVFVRLFS